MRYLHLIFAIIFTSIIASCGSKSTEHQKSAELDITIPNKALSAGFQLLEQNCFSCHSPQGALDNRIAPPMIAIKKHYIEDGISKDAFIKSLTQFILNPTEENSKMPNAIKKLGLMPVMNFSELEIAQIANYIYDTELEAPDWFDKHYKEEIAKYIKETPLDSLSYMEIGKKYAMRTKSTLGKNLLGAIQKGGSAYAVGFCNERAVTLTDSMAMELSVQIKRVSDQPRNSQNQASDLEIAYINQAKSALIIGDQIKPISYEINGRVHAYYPIVTNAMCLQCHGAPQQEIEQLTFDKINKLYPTDQATSYQANQLRGIWVVEMDKKLNE